MSKFIRGSVLILSAALMGGCASNTETKSEAPAAPPHAEKVADGKSYVMQSGGKDVLKFTLSKDTNAEPKGNLLNIKGPTYDLQVWLVPDVKSMDEAIAGLDKTIVGEVKDWKATKTTDLTIAGTPAKRLVGTGHEADDGDDAEADAIVFKVGDNVLVALAHGETPLKAAMHEGLLTVVQTAQKP